MFEDDKNYKYDATIPVNANAYLTASGGKYNVPVDITKLGAFVESDCTPAVSEYTCWDGSFLNWFSARRIDASRKALVGGKLESETAFTYSGTNNSTYQYKIVANNEPEDPQFKESYSDSESLSPVLNGKIITVTSPAGREANSGNTQTTYDPYAKLSYPTGIILDNSGNTIGEIGTTRIRLVNRINWQSVTFEASYSSTPIVVAKALSYNGPDPAIVRIKDVTATGFKISLQEWPNSRGHAKESISYIVMKSGSHTLPGDFKAKAQKIETNEEYYNGCSVNKTDKETVEFVGSDFDHTPVVMAAVTTYNDPNPVHVRAWDSDKEEVKISLQEAENDTTSHSTEDVSIIAIEPGTITSNGVSLVVGTLEMDADPDYTDWYTHAFSSTLSETPTLFLAGMQTMAGDNTAAMRWKNLTDTSVDLLLEEERPVTMRRRIFPRWSAISSPYRTRSNATWR